jgi:hypothetical protein
MDKITIGNKKYVILSEREYNDLRLKAVLKASGVNKMSLKEGKELAYRLVDKYATRMQKTL